MRERYLPLSGILPPFSKAHTEGKTLKMIPKRYTKTACLRMPDRNGERSLLCRE